MLLVTCNCVDGMTNPMNKPDLSDDDDLLQEILMANAIGIG